MSRRTFLQKHGRPFVAFVTSVVAWFSVFASVYLRAIIFHTLDVGTIMEASAILTAAATAYSAGAALVKARQAEFGDE